LDEFNELVGNLIAFGFSDALFILQGKRPRFLFLTVFIVV